MTTPALALRSRAERLAAPFPPLLADAERLARTIMLGTHGRRQSGPGDEFWQYRTAHQGDAARSIDWRRSARSDSHFVREKEWQTSQSVWVWTDTAQSMSFASSRSLPAKSDRARLLALAMTILLIRSGERVGLVGARRLDPGAGEAQLHRITEILGTAGSEQDYASPDLAAVQSHGRVLLISDFLSDPAALEREVADCAGRGVRGALLQVLDPQEISFPFTGRTIFESVGRSIAHETLRARDLKAAYLDRLDRRRDLLATLCRRNGWLFHPSRTDRPAQTSLLWAYRALERRH